MENPHTDTQIEKLQSYIETVKNAIVKITEDARNGKFTPTSEEQIKYLLSHSPDMIAESGLMLAEFRNEYEQAKFHTKLTQAEIWSKCNRNKDLLGLSNAKDREAYVLSQPQFIEAIDHEREWKYRMEQMQVIAERYQNLYVSVRKLASMFIQERENYDRGI